MKKYLPLSIAAVAAVLTFAPTVHAERYMVREYRDAKGDRIVERTVVQRDDPWIVRAGRTVVRTPLIIGETVTGRRQIVRDDDRVVRDNRVVYYRDNSRFHDGMHRTGRTVVLAPEPIAESHHRADGRTLLGRGPCDDLELFGD